MGQSPKPNYSASYTIIGTPSLPPAPAAFAILFPSGPDQFALRASSSPDEVLRLYYFPFNELSQQLDPRLPGALLPCLTTGLPFSTARSFAHHVLSSPDERWGAEAPRRIEFWSIISSENKDCGITNRRLEAIDLFEFTPFSPAKKRVIRSRHSQSSCEVVNALARHSFMGSSQTRRLSPFPPTQELSVGNG